MKERMERTMNVFSVGDKIPHELTRENYFEITRKRFPFFQDPKQYATPYFAICPLCNNPIQIINLFGVYHKEEKTGRTNLHGRHYPHNVNGLPPYSEKNYISCPLHNPITFRMKEVRKNEQINEDICNLIEKNRAAICASIREITGILITNNRLGKLISDYICAKEYCYTYTNPFNIPYSILYTRESISIFGQKIADSPIGKKIKLAIQNNSKLFHIEGERIQKNNSAYVEIHLLAIHHTVENNKQYLTLRIEERHGQSNVIVFEEKVEMKPYIFTEK